MRVLTQQLKNRKINLLSLLEYGFQKNEDTYAYKTNICNNKFTMIVWVQNNKMFSKLIDLETNDEYVLADLNNSSGYFIGMVKTEYDRQIQEIIDKCTNSFVFKSEQANILIKHVIEKYKDSLEFLWEKFSSTAIWRNKVNQKWYGFLATVSKRKLQVDSDEIVEILVTRCPEDKMQTLLDGSSIFKGYHMNKKSWITIVLDNSVDSSKIIEILDESYQISLTK